MTVDKCGLMEVWRGRFTEDVIDLFISEIISMPRLLRPLLSTVAKSPGALRGLLFPRTNALHSLKV